MEKNDKIIPNLTKNMAGSSYEFQQYTESSIVFQARLQCQDSSEAKTAKACTKTNAPINVNPLGGRPGKGVGFEL